MDAIDNEKIKAICNIINDFGRSVLHINGELILTDSVDADANRVLVKGVVINITDFLAIGTNLSTVGMSAVESMRLMLQKYDDKTKRQREYGRPISYIWYKR